MTSRKVTPQHLQTSMCTLSYVSLPYLLNRSVFSKVLLSIFPPLCKNCSRGRFVVQLLVLYRSVSRAEIVIFLLSNCNCNAVWMRFGLLFIFQRIKIMRAKHGVVWCRDNSPHKNNELKISIVFLCWKMCRFPLGGLLGVKFCEKS